MTDLREVGRLAFRKEGNMYRAYYTLPGTMEGALYLGELHLSVADNDDARKAFIKLMREVISKVLKEIVGDGVTSGEPIIKEK